VSQVLSGEKCFTLEQSETLMSHLGLSGIEAEYLMLLILYERAGSTDLKKYWRQKMTQVREQSMKIANRIKIDRALSDTERAVFYSSPLYTAIQIYSSVGSKGKSLDEICHRFDLNRKQAAEILKFLVESGLCAEHNDSYTMGVQKTHLAQGSPFLPRHHTNWRVRAIQRSENLDEKELMYTAPVSLSKKDFEILREEMAMFIKTFLDRVHASEAEEIACFNLDFFWIDK
jgi:hypothetical protein